MKSTIQRRIEAIQRGETPKGYKKSQWGTIPSNWNEVRLRDVIIEYKQVSTVNNQYPVLTSSRKGLMLQTDYFNNRQVTTDNNIGYNIIPRGFITFRSRTDDGRFVFNTNNLIDYGIISYFYPVFSFNATVNSAFLVSLLNYSIYNRFRPFVEGTAQQVLSLRKLGNLIYPLPPLSEQEAIAEILTQQDRLIDLKQRLIDEKLRQKKYLMQTLLTGKIRLPGFKDKWKTKTLGEILEMRKTKIDPKSTKQNYPCIDLEHINGEKACLIGSSDSLQSLSVKTQFYKGDILFGKLRPYLRKIIIAPFDGVCCSEIWAFSVSNNTNNYFVFQYLRLDRIIAKANITTGTKMPRSDWDSFQNIAIPLPPLPEQEAIAEVFSTADEELSLLERELEQEKLRKKALMQLLLTGLVRVEEL